MIVRLSEKSDINGIVSLWNEAFGDTENEIMFFLNRKYIPENTVVAEENGEIASMLFLLDGKMFIDGKDYPSYYLYAACTLKKYRGKGLMAELLCFAKQLADLRAYKFICLMPGEKTLFDFYEKHGYKSVFSRKVLTLDRNNNAFSDEMHCCDSIDYEQIRNKVYGKYNYFKWDNQSVKFAADHTVFYSGNEFHNCEGYCLYSVTDDVLRVKEFAFTEDKLPEIISKICLMHDCSKATVILPSSYETDCGEYEIQPSAMMLAIDDHASEIIKNLSNAYLGLTLD